MMTPIPKAAPVPVVYPVPSNPPARARIIRRVQPVQRSIPVAKPPARSLAREKQQNTLFYKKQTAKPQQQIPVKQIADKSSYNPTMFSHSHANIVRTGDGRAVTSSGGAVTCGGWDRSSANHESKGLGRDSYSVRR